VRTVVLSNDYAERVYAGVLGKVIGVYLGRPVEGWRHEEIAARLGEIRHYVNDQLGARPLVVPDDDITGTFVFLRALGDYPDKYPGDMDAARVGQTWLNYAMEGRTVLWWGGRGNSTEHTAYLLLKEGVPPPESGSIARNGRVVAEQVGAQIFCEGWAMTCPGDPDGAAALAAEAASVSHDGEALNAARVVAALVALAFVETDVERMVRRAVAVVDEDSLIARVDRDVLDWHASGQSWRDGRARIESTYGYDQYGGNCHVVPNHAIVIHALLHGEGDFTRSVGISASCGWDTDSNTGNVGCVAGVFGGVDGIDRGADWRGPVADRLYLPTADGGGAVTDTAREALTIVQHGRAHAGLPPLTVKANARFHFEFSGSVQGFAAWPPDSCLIDNVPGHSAIGARSLALRRRADAAMALTATFVDPGDAAGGPYQLVASPTLHSGQRVRAGVSCAGAAAVVRLVIRVYGAADELRDLAGPAQRLNIGDRAELDFTVPSTGGHPIGQVGIAIDWPEPGPGTVNLDYLTWDGPPEVTLGRPVDGGTRWQRAWVDAVDRLETHRPEDYRLIQDHGVGLLMQGSRDWTDYVVSTQLTPHLARGVGLAARVQGLTRHYSVRLADRRRVELVRTLGGETVLAEAPFPWEFGQTHALRLRVKGEHIQAFVDDTELSATDPGTPLRGGGVALLVDEGRTAAGAVRVAPIGRSTR
jgi:ADP-ribosylglycohydrolase